MKKKFFTLLAVMLMALAANAEKTITWDYNTIKGIDFSTEAHYHSGADSYRPIISKDGITWLGFVDAYSSIYLENCNLGTNTSHDYAPTLFFSNIGSISSIVITCDDGEGTIYDEDYNEWTTSQTSVVWTNGGFNTKVNMPLKEKSEIKGITQITFTVEDNDIRSYIAYGFPVSWKVNGEYTDGVYETSAGETLLITPYTNRVITNIKAIDATSYETTYLVNNGNGSWILPSMPAYNVMIWAKYEGDEPDPGPKTITWDYNTIKGIDFDINNYVEDDIVIPIISKNGITLSYNWGDKPSELYFKDCNLGIDFNSSYYDSNTLNFISTVGNITSIAITCSDGENALWDEEYYGWTTSKTSITWHGDPAHTVEMPFADNSEITGITQIIFTVDDADTPTYTISDIPDGWKVNGSTTNGTCEVKVGAMVIFTPANIPAGKKINSISFVEATSSKYTSQLFEKSDGTWVLGIMPNYDGKLVVVYKDNDNPVTQHTIYNIPSGWKVNGSTTNGTYKAEEGAEVIFTPANIPAGKKIKSIKVVKQ